MSAGPGFLVSVDIGKGESEDGGVTEIGDDADRDSAMQRLPTGGEGEEESAREIAYSDRSNQRGDLGWDTAVGVGEFAGASRESGARR